MTPRGLVGVVGLAIAMVGLTAGAGPWGLVAALVVAAAWVLVPRPFAFAAGQVLAVAVLPATPGLPLVATQVGLLALLVEPLLSLDRPVTGVVTVVVATGGLLLLAGGLVATGRPAWLAALALALVAATAAYGLHRYERVRLGLVGEGG